MKNIVAWVVAGLLLVAFVLVFVLSLSIGGKEVIGNFGDISEKRAKAQELVMKKDSLQDQKMTIEVQEGKKEKELADVQESADTADKSFNDLVSKQRESGDWDYHVPSLIVKLESKADDAGVDLAVNYESVKKNGEQVVKGRDGLATKIVDVEIFGGFHEVKNYIKSVESMDTISVNVADLDQVKQGELTGTFNMEVFYME